MGQWRRYSHKHIWIDVYMISGSANGITRDGRTYSMNTTNDLEIALNCRWIKSGTISIKPENFDERIVDYEMEPAIALLLIP